MNGSTDIPSIEMILIPFELKPNESILALEVLTNLNLAKPFLFIEYSGNFFPLII